MIPAIALSDNAVTERSIADGAVDVDKIKSDAANADKFLGWDSAGNPEAKDAPTGPTGGLQSVASDGSLSGDGTSANPLKIAVSGVSNNKLAPGAVGQSKIADGAVTGAKLADRAVTNAKIGNSAVHSEHINDSAVETDKIEDGAVNEDKLANDAVTNAKIDDGAVTDGKIANNAISTNKIRDDAVTSAKIQGAAVREEQLANSAVTEPRIANSAVSTNKIRDGAVDTPKIEDNAVTSAKIADNAIHFGHIEHDTSYHKDFLTWNAAGTPVARKLIGNESTYNWDDSNDTETFIDTGIDIPTLDYDYLNIEIEDPTGDGIFRPTFKINMDRLRALDHISENDETADSHGKYYSIPIGSHYHRFALDSANDLLWAISNSALDGSRIRVRGANC